MSPLKRAGRSSAAHREPPGPAPEIRVPAVGAGDPDAEEVAARALVWMGEKALAVSGPVRAQKGVSAGGREVVGCGAVPVPLVGWGVDDIAGPDLLPTVLASNASRNTSRALIRRSWSACLRSASFTEAVRLVARPSATAARRAANSSASTVAERRILVSTRHGYERGTPSERAVPGHAVPG
jgi:hypothetical protein